MAHIIKKNIGVLVCCFVIAQLSYALDSSQKMYEVGCETYSDICFLYAVSGFAQPSSSGPWTGAELRKMMAQVPEEALSDSAKLVYQRVHDALYDEAATTTDSQFSFLPEITTQPEVYFHTNTMDFPKAEDFSYGYNEQGSLLSVDLSTLCTQSVYMKTVFDLKTPATSTTGRGKTLFSNNIPYLQNWTVGKPQPDTGFPYVAYVSLGNNNLSAMIGKDQLSWGDGVTGNMTISDNLDYHNFARFNAFFNTFKYTYLLDFFPHPKNYGNINQFQDVSGLKFYQAHRFEKSLFHNKLRASVTESIMYQSDSNYVDLSVINPLAIYHNYWIRKNANSELSIEASYAPVPKVTLYGQFLSDDMSVIGEPSQAESESANPNARGFLAGIKYTTDTATGVFYSSLEGAMTDPLTYHRDDVDFVVGLRRFSNETARSVTYDLDYLGYPYGGDAMVCNLNAGWKKASLTNAGKFGFEGNAFFMEHGVLDETAVWRQIGKYTYQNFITPTTCYTPKDPTNAEEQKLAARQGYRTTLDIGVSGFWYPTEKLKLYSQIDFIQIWNNDYAGHDAFDMQCVVGAKYQF